MLDRVAQVGAGFDWITPLITMIQDWMWGPIHRFAVPYGAGWSGKQIGALLKRCGVPSWGWLVRYDTVFFRVRLRQARWAQYVLLREGVPVEEGLLQGGYARPGALGHGGLAPVDAMRGRPQASGWVEELLGALGL